MTKRPTTYMLTSETARALHVSSSTIADWADLGRLPALRTPGGTRLFAVKDVERFRASYVKRGRWQSKDSDGR
jgi:excisionase family DNA binding protein